MRLTSKPPQDTLVLAGYRLVTIPPMRGSTTFCETVWSSSEEH